VWRDCNIFIYALQDPEALVLPRVVPVKNGRMTIHYHCEGRPVGETTFAYSPETYAEWFRSMAKALGEATASAQSRSRTVGSK
jgi:hypothetical protein